MANDLTEKILNMHDVYLNCTLQKQSMLKSPIPEKVEQYHYCDRGRYERTWISFLYVLCEAWTSSRDIQQYATKSRTGKKLIDIMKRGRLNRKIEEMRKVRDYMCHRDKRAYWDEGRIAVINIFQYCINLDSAFSAFFLEAMQSEY